MDNLDKKDTELKQKSHLLVYDLLKSFASWLDNPDNEIFELLEYDEGSLNVAAKANVLAAGILRKAALDIQLVSGIEDTNKYEYNMEDALQNLISIANEFDESQNPNLIKKAGLIDEIILTMSSNAIEQDERLKKAMNEKIEKIKNKSEKPKKKASIDDTDGGSYRPLQVSLTTRSFPGSPGTPMVRVSDGVYYNIDTGEQVDFTNGYDLDGKKVPGTSVENQTDSLEGFKISTQFE